MCCKALHERHPGRGNSKAKLALVAFGERERGGVGVGLEHLDLPAARVLNDFPSTVAHVSTGCLCRSKK